MLALLWAGKRELSQISFRSVNDMICARVLKRNAQVKALILTQLLWKKRMATFRGVDVLAAGLALWGMKRGTNYKFIIAGESKELQSRSWWWSRAYQTSLSGLVLKPQIKQACFPFDTSKNFLWNLYTNVLIASVDRVC